MDRVIEVVADRMTQPMDCYLGPRNDCILLGVFDRPALSLSPTIFDDSDYRPEYGEIRRQGPRHSLPRPSANLLPDVPCLYDPGCCGQQTWPAPRQGYRGPWERLTPPPSVNYPPYPSLPPINRPLLPALSSPSDHPSPALTSS